MRFEYKLIEKDFSSFIAKKIAKKSKLLYGGVQIPDPIHHYF